MALAMVTVTGRIVQPDNTTPAAGTLVFTPAAGMLTSSSDHRILAGRVSAELGDDGSFTIELPATDNEGIQPEPNTWTWAVQFRLDGGISLTPFSFAAPASAGTVYLDDVARLAPAPGTYLVIPGPAGPTGPKGDPGSATDALRAVNNLSDLDDPAAAREHLGLGTAATAATAAFDAAGTATAAADGAQSAAIAAAAADATSKANAAATTAETTAAADATGKIGVHTAANDPHGDRAWAAGACDAIGTAAAALTSAAAYADAADADTLATAKAYTDTHAGGGSAPSTVPDDRIDAEIIVLTAAASWTLVRTSGGAVVGKSIAAAPGDRIIVSPSFMYTGTQFYLDLAVMAGEDSGTVSRYASSSGTGTTPGPEGYAPYYPQAASFPHVSGLRQFVATAGEIDTAGLFTVNLAYTAPSLSGTDQKIYVGNGYIGALLLINLGPAPT